MQNTGIWVDRFEAAQFDDTLAANQAQVVRTTKGPLISLRLVVALAPSPRAVSVRPTQSQLIAF